MRIPPARWRHLGCVLERGLPGCPDESVTGDPCIVWDENQQAWRMFYFGQRHEGGRERNCIMSALSQGRQGVQPGQWRKCGPISYVNPWQLPGDAHKPFILMDAFHPNQPARIQDMYWLYMVLWVHGHKQIFRASAPNLAGPWLFEPTPVLSLGSSERFDGYHVDTVSAFHFAQRHETLIIYKGYPAVMQADTPRSPYGSRSAAAWLPDGQVQAKRAETLFRPEGCGMWYSGWIGGVQLIPDEEGGWWALLSASATPPASIDEEPDMREPAPSLGGWACTRSANPLSGWTISPEPITSLDSLPQEAVLAGEGVNLWRHHLLMVDEREIYLFYNSGPYGSERMFICQAVLP